MVFPLFITALSTKSLPGSLEAWFLDLYLPRETCQGLSALAGLKVRRL